jgi:hypothetical protein
VSRDPTEDELREAILPHAKLLGCTCRFKVTWGRDGDLAHVEVEHADWCRVGRNVPTFGGKGGTHSASNARQIRPRISPRRSSRPVR